jgi:hypothetical protein
MDRDGVFNDNKDDRIRIKLIKHKLSTITSKLWRRKNENAITCN